MAQALDIFIIAIAIGFILLSTYYLLKNHHHRTQHRLRQKIFEALFANLNGIEISKQDRAEMDNDHRGLGYGEITFEGFSEMLAIAHPKPGEIFYDLGSGAGKAVLCAALLYDWKKCCGIELLPSLYQLSRNQLARFQRMSQKKGKHTPSPTIQLIHADFLSYDISEANVIFVNATVFFEPFWQQVAAKLQTTTSGTRIIVASKRLDENQFQLLDAQMLPMSWGLCSVHIYCKKNNVS